MADLTTPRGRMPPMQGSPSGKLGEDRIATVMRHRVRQEPEGLSLAVSDKEHILIILLLPYEG